MQSEKKITFLDRLRNMRETEFGAFLPVLFALAAIWGYFGFILPLHDLITGEAESFRAIFLSPRNIYNLFMQSAVIAALAVGITVVLLLGEIDLSAAATAGVCAALLGVLVLSGVPGFLACLIVIFVGIIMGAAQGLLVAYVGIPSFVVTLAGLLGYQGLMQKILPTGNLNVGDPFVRSIARLLIPDMWGLFLALVVFVLFLIWPTNRFISLSTLRTANSESLKPKIEIRPVAKNISGSLDSRSSNNLNKSCSSK